MCFCLILNSASLVCGQRLYAHAKFTSGEQHTAVTIFHNFFNTFVQLNQKEQRTIRRRTGKISYVLDSASAFNVVRVEQSGNADGRTDRERTTQQGYMRFMTNQMRGKQSTYIHIIYIDYPKAFDKVTHLRPAAKPQAFGVQELEVRFVVHKTVIF